MRKGFYQYWTDLRFVIQLPLSIGFFICFLIAIVVVDVANHNSSPVHAIFIARTLVGPFSTCLTVFLSIRLYLKDTDHYLLAYPLSFVWPFIGKWLSIMTYISIYTVTTLVVFLCSASSWGIQGSVLWTTIDNLFISMELSYALATSLGLFIAAILRSSLAYFIGFSIWLSSTFLFQFVASEKLFLLPFKVSPIMNMTDNIEPVWGMILAHQEETTLWSVIIALIVFFFTGAMVVTVLRRPTKYIIAPLITLLAALVFVGISMTLHFLSWSHQFNDLKEHHSVSIPIANAGAQPHPVFKVTDYQIDLFKDGDMWTLNSRLNVDIPKFPSDRKLSFTINPDFNVEQITINGRIVDYSQHNGWIDLSINDFDHLATHQSMSFIYTGQLDEWGIDEKGEESWYAFTKGDTFYLPAHLAWYPLPGRVPLYFQESKNVYVENPSSALTNTPINYTIRIHDLDKPVFSTAVTTETIDHKVQEMIGTNRTGITLFSGSFKTWESKNVSAVLPAYYDHVRPTLTSEIGSLRDFLQDTFKKPIHGKLVFLPINEELFNSRRKMEKALILPCRKLDQLSDHPVDALMEDRMIDYFLTGGKLLQGNLGDSSNLNKDYVHAINDLYQHVEGNDEKSENQGPMVQQVMSEINNDHDILLQKFLRTLIENQKDPDHPIITKEEWNLAWDDAFKNGA